MLGHLRSEQSAKIEADAKSRSLADELQRLNQQIQKEAPQGPTQLPTSSVGPLEYHMDSPPGLEPQKPKTRIPEGGPPDDDDNDDDDDDNKCKKEKKSKKDKKRKKKKRDSSTSSSSSSIPRDVVKALLKKMIKKDEDDEKDKDKGDKEKKEKTKEAEKVVFPKFPQPENYRNWRLRVREAVVAASNKPDHAFKWPSKVWDKDTKIDDLRDTEGFPTLDAKVLSAITNVLEGEFARQIDSFKEREAHAGRLVRGRQVLAKLDAYFATSALHGSLYELEDLLGVKLINENLITFMSNWDTVLSGMKVTPDDTFLEPLFHRQVKKCKSISHELLFTKELLRELRKDPMHTSIKQPVITWHVVALTATANAWHANWGMISPHFLRPNVYPKAFASRL